MGFSRQEYWNGLPCSPPGDLPNPGIKPASLTSPALTDGFLTPSATWEVLLYSWVLFFLNLHSTYYQCITEDLTFQGMYSCPSISTWQWFQTLQIPKSAAAPVPYTKWWIQSPLCIHRFGVWWIGWICRCRTLRYGGTLLNIYYRENSLIIWLL